MHLNDIYNELSTVRRGWTAVRVREHTQGRRVGGNEGVERPWLTGVLPGLRDGGNAHGWSKHRPALPLYDEHDAARAVELFAETIRRTTNRGGSVLSPAFAVDRTGRFDPLWTLMSDESAEDGRGA